jgi:hypothetical protein
VVIRSRTSKKNRQYNVKSSNTVCWYSLNFDTHVKQQLIYHMLLFSYFYVWNVQLLNNVFYHALVLFEQSTYNYWNTCTQTLLNYLAFCSVLLIIVCLLIFFHLTSGNQKPYIKEEQTIQCKDTKVVIRSRTSKKNRQYNVKIPTW